MSGLRRHAGKKEGLTDQDDTYYGVQHDRDCHDDVSQGDEHSNGPVRAEAFGHMRVGKSLHLDRDDLRKLEKLTNSRIDGLRLEIAGRADRGC